MTPPYGKYTELLTATVAFVVILAAVANNLLTIPVLSHQTGLIDNMAWLAFGAMFGTRAAVNGYAGQVVAAHKRLDLIGAPNADSSIPAPAKP